MKRYKIAVILLCTVLIVLLLLVMGTVLTGCRESTIVNYNMSKSADNFNITRRVVALNSRTDTVMFELVGRFSLSNNSTNELVITCEVAEGEYKKHYIYLNDDTLYVVEDVSGSYVDPYHYEVNFLPQMIGGVTITMED